MKYSRNYERDWEFFNKMVKEEKYINIRLCDYESQCSYSCDGLSAKECFYLFDTYGNREPTNEPELYVKIWGAKQAINLYIKEWVNGTMEGATIPIEIQEHCVENDYPDWVYLSYIRQLNKIRYGKGREIGMTKMFKRANTKDLLDSYHK